MDPKSRAAVQGKVDPIERDIAARNHDLTIGNVRHHARDGDLFPIGQCLTGRCADCIVDASDHPMWST